MTGHLTRIALVLSVFALSCRAEKSPDAAACTGLFGLPGEHTGLTTDQCKPQCSCGGKDFTYQEYSDATVQGLIDGWQETHPAAPLTTDPYQDAEPASDPPGLVCAVHPEGSGTPRPYSLVTYASETEATAAGAKVTHAGRCGLCSNLVNLAVYLRQKDLTGPVRSCGLKAGNNVEADVECLKKLGFDLPCAQIWAYNTIHTRSICLETCVENLSAPYNLPDGGLNDCIACDEENSGKVFKAVAGRTRRNSGIPDELCRPCDQVAPVVHAY